MYGLILQQTERFANKVKGKHIKIRLAVAGLDSGPEQKTTVMV